MKVLRRFISSVSSGDGIAVSSGLESSINVLRLSEVSSLFQKDRQTGPYVVSESLKDIAVYSDEYQRPPSESEIMRRDESNLLAIKTRAQFPNA
jgi:hypothetical protein